jgi:hypothetical protein
VAESRGGEAGGPWAGLYERETELAALSAALAEARDGTGGLVVVEGPRLTGTMWDFPSPGQAREEKR